MSELRFFLALIQSSISGARGQGLAEYALILALIAVAAIAVLLLLGARIGSVFTKVSTSI
jgi:pilus assembly protein Flp/PilA